MAGLRRCTAVSKILWCSTTSVLNFAVKAEIVYLLRGEITLWRVTESNQNRNIQGAGSICEEPTTRRLSQLGLLCKNEIHRTNVLLFVLLLAIALDSRPRTAKCPLILKPLSHGAGLQAASSSPWRQLLVPNELFGVGMIIGNFVLKRPYWKLKLFTGFIEFSYLW